MNYKLFGTAISFAIMLTLPATAFELHKARSFNRPAAGMQISASFQTVIPLTTKMSVEEQARATENARRSLYEIASRECAVITKVFKGECKIIRLNVRSYVQNRGNGIQQISINANASYRVREDMPGDGDRYEKKL